MSTTKGPAALPSTRKVIRQYGFRINETGVEKWGRVDLQYHGTNSDSMQDVVKRADNIVLNAANVGVPLTYTLLYRDHLTTSWSRWLKVEEVRP